MSELAVRYRFSAGDLRLKPVAIINVQPPVCSTIVLDLIGVSGQTELVDNDTPRIAMRFMSDKTTPEAPF